MPTDSYLIPALFMFTFVVAIAFAIYQYRKAKKARAEHHESAQAKVLGEQPGERHISPIASDTAMAAEQNSQRPNTLRS
jgi:fructose-specific phosphotransferase system IIC component